METFEDLPGALDQLHREGHLGSEALRTRLEERLRAFLAGPTLRRWFSPQWRVYTEIDLLAPASGARGEAPALRPDRLLVGEERVVILDYKTGGTRNEALPLPKDVKQMQRYLERTRPIFPQHQVEGHLLYLDAENHFPVQKAQNP
jgi:ATP-dependent exoDNAse (exonuclease V) beta subunit